MTTDDTTARIAELKAKLAARRGKAGFAANCVAIEEEIARLEAPACPDCGSAPSPQP